MTRKTDVGDAHGFDALVIASELQGLFDLVAQALKALFGDRCEQRFFVGEVAIGRRMRNARTSRRFAQRDARGALLGHQLERGIDECAAQITVVIFAAFVGDLGRCGVGRLFATHHEATFTMLTSANQA